MARRLGFVSVILALIVCSAAVLGGCQGLSSALGLQPTATAPVFNGIGIAALPGSEVWIDGASPDNSGAVGASGTASQSAEQRQVTQIDPAAVAKGIAEAAAVVVPGGRAAKALAGAEAALQGGDVVRADKLTKAAKGFAAAEADAAKAEAAAAPPAPVKPADQQ